jgi:predicted flap endonuclease-1-like 5' DNA nuclease
MLNPAHILEIALLLLVAFLAGAVLGALVRLAVARLMPARALGPTPVVVAEPPKPEEQPALVAAPVIGEVVKTPTPTAPAEVPALDFTEALLALAGDKPGSPASQIQMPTIAPLPAVAVTKPAEPMRPARVAGETTSGRVVAHPRSSAEPVRTALEGAGAEVIPFPLDKVAVEGPEPPTVVVAMPMPVAESVVPVVAEEVSKPEPEAESVAEAAVEPVIEQATAARDEVVQPDAVIADATEASAATELPVPEAEASSAAADASLENALENVTATEIVESELTAPPEQPAAAPEPLAIVSPEPSTEDDEAAAMRAIEGNWSPRRTASPRTRRAALPELSAEAAIVASAAAVASASEAAGLATATEPAEAPGKPSGIAAPRLGVKDDLTHIIGILPIIETALNNLGLYHFDQIAELSDDNAGWIENHLGIAGRIAREHWREQARGLIPATVETKKAAGQQ